MARLRFRQLAYLFDQKVIKDWSSLRRDEVEGKKNNLTPGVNQNENGKKESQSAHSITGAGNWWCPDDSVEDIATGQPAKPFDLTPENKENQFVLPVFYIFNLWINLFS